MNLTPIIWTSVSEDGVVLTLRYLCDPRKRRTTANDLWEKILDEFAKHDRIDFAYRTHRQYLNPQEGKLKGRASQPAVREIKVDTTEPRR